MAFDRNPKFGADSNFESGARRVADLLWETTKGDVSTAPTSYLENLRYEFSDGNISMLELIDRVDLGPEATYEDYCEVVEALMSVDPDSWPNPEYVEEVQQSKLQYEIEPGFDFEEFNFAEEPTGDALSQKVEAFLKKVIASVYLDGVTAITDAEGNPPNEQNNYLLSEDGTAFTGIFYDSPPNEQAKKFPFAITEGEGGKWQIKY